jgi:hypothetical protein
MELAQPDGRVGGIEGHAVIVQGLNGKAKPTPTTERIVLQEGPARGRP